MEMVFKSVEGAGMFVLPVVLEPKGVPFAVKEWCVV